MKVARLEVSPELLVELMHLPRGTSVRGASWIWRYGHEFVELLVQHDDLKEVLIGDATTEFPLVQPTWTKQPEIVFNGWGQEEQPHEVELDDRVPYHTGYKA